MATCPMCNADDVSDDLDDLAGHDMTKHPEKTSEDQGDEEAEDQS